MGSGFNHVVVYYDKTDGKLKVEDLTGLSAAAQKERADEVVDSLPYRRLEGYKSDEQFLGIAEQSGLLKEVDAALGKTLDLQEFAPAAPAM